MPLLISEYVPQSAASEEAARRRRAGLWAWGAATAFGLLALGLAVSAPALRAQGSPLLSQVVYKLFSGACHQIPERSFYLWGFPLAVCARCAGLYAGAAAGLLAYPLVRRPLARTDAPPRAWLLLAALPTAVDLLLGLTGLWENTHLSRFLTALLAGAAAAFYVVPGCVELGVRGLRRFVGQLDSREGRRGEVSRLT